MRSDLAGANEGVADKERGGAEAVENCIECGKKGELCSRHIGGRVFVDQPEEKERSCGANGKNGQNGWKRICARLRSGCRCAHTFLSVWQWRRPSTRSAEEAG